MPGSSDPAGEKEELGEGGKDYVDLLKSNWKQCVWKRNDGKESGLIQVSDHRIECHKYWKKITGTN